MENNKISKRIRKEYAAGATQNELAVKYHISQAKVSDFLNEKTCDMNMRWSFIKRMFPHATIHLDGSDVDMVLIQNQKKIIENVKKIVNDPTIPDDKARKVIQILLD